jgi:diaminopimelate decarboxylase
VTGSNEDGGGTAGRGGTGAASKAGEASSPGAGLAAAGTQGDSAAGILRDGLLAGLDPAALAAEFGTPFYVYDLDLIGRRFDALRAVLPPGFRVAFAVKANPALAVLAHLRRCGAGADIASEGELAAILRAGFDPAAVAMTGPGKRDHELDAAVAAGIGMITCESFRELRRLESIAADRGRRQRVLLRLAVSEDARLETVRLIGGVEGKFGMPLPVLREAALYAAASPHLELTGIHAFGASNLRDADELARHVEELVEIGRGVAAEAGVPLRIVDAGGGLGIAYGSGEHPLDLARFGRRMTRLRQRWDAVPELSQMTVILEPGRFIVGPAGAYVARVVDIKGTDSAPVAILDGGINHAVRPALVRSEHRLAVLAGATAAVAAPGPGPTAAEAVDLATAIELRPSAPTTVAGPLCTGIDVFTTKQVLPRPQVGDLVAVLDLGAYGFTESMPMFLSHPWPAEVCVRGGQARLTRPRMLPDELLDRQSNPDW